ncbi:MFS transporter [Chitinophaga horti]|uniref:MFS transporter n=1 Tax=Chitinophaga horti TaxID=2920382 RepID=A0ABY6J343_9BACT|nr:MFS transporter [Chitinophaga horti]UYQ94086.1 MFS transporter [Chitinophaga horti]
MSLRPSEHLSETAVKKGLNLVILDGLATEAMVVFTAGSILTALALGLGATNFQIGLLAALPTFTNVFQLLTIWLVQRFNNRRAIAVICSTLARTPIVIIGLLPFLFSTGTSLYTLFCLLFLHYFFGSVSGASWNSWMKDLVPGDILGSFFSRRTRYTQTLNVTLSLGTALVAEYVKNNYPGREIETYTSLFLLGGIFGLSGVLALYRTPEPKQVLEKENIFGMLKRPFKDQNFRRLLVFNACWIFALSLATPFVTVYMLRTLEIPLSYIIGLGILSQLSSIFSLNIWGKYIDKFSNKNVILICAPLYIACFITWALIAKESTFVTKMIILGAVHLVTGLSTAGINLSLNNIGIKLAPRGQAMIYLSTKNMSVAFAAAMAPLLGGLMADYFQHRQLLLEFIWKTPSKFRDIYLLNLQQWNFFFAITAILALLSLNLLRRVRESGEVHKQVIIREMAISLSTRIKETPGHQMLHRYVLLPAAILKDKLGDPEESRMEALLRLKKRK